MTNAEAVSTPARRVTETTVFSRVIAGADGREPGFEAVRQAARLVADDGWLEIFTAVHLAEATLAGWSAARMAAELEDEARDAIRRGEEIAGARAESQLVIGHPLDSLIKELRERSATLAVVGTHGQSRLSEMVLGGVVGELLHRAPCSVLVARPPLIEPLFPRTIVAGSDGSLEAGAAVDAARYLARRFAAPLRIVTATKGKALDLARAQVDGDVERVDGDPVSVLVAASDNADILVVGSRGLHGLRALGSVSERVAHEARCSVLVVHKRP